jgi:acyl-CoA reductase-like NAD-dependent aldehyde dehydrogenase
MDRHQLLVAGAWGPSESGEWASVRSPVTGEILGDVPVGTRADVDRAIEAASSAFEEWSSRSPFERATIFHAISDVVMARREDLAELLTLEQGKPRLEATSEVEATARDLHGAAEDSTRMEGHILPSEARSKRVFAFRRPHGVVGVLTPWNFPLMIPCEYLGPALATGNTVVWSPSSTSPLIGLALARCFVEGGLPAGVLNVVTGPGSIVGDQIVGSSHVQMIGLTGSSQTGRAVAERAAGKHLLLELGGNGPVVVLDDADLAIAARLTAFGAFFNAGQTCAASERVIVHDRVADEFTELVVDAAKAVRLGDPRVAATSMGPLNNEAVAAKMDRHVDDARRKGARILIGGRRAPGHPTDLYYEPTVIVDVTADMVVSREESFGPIVPITRVGSDAEAIIVANTSGYGLSAALFTGSLHRAFAVGERLRSGIVNVNDASNYWELHIPGGGASGSASGHGRIGGRFTIAEMTELRTLIVDLDKVADRETV